MISYFDEVNNDLNETLEWKESVEGRNFDFPKIHAMHKSIILKGWKTHIWSVKKLASDASEMSNALVESINDYILESNLISSCPQDSMLDVEILRCNWHEQGVEFTEKVNQLRKIDLEANWHFLVKPHTNWLVLKLLTNISSQMLSSLQEAIFSSETQIKPRSPLELEIVLNLQKSSKRWIAERGSTSKNQISQHWRFVLIWNHIISMPF